MKPVVTYDIFCDASVGPDLRGCCSGALIERREPIQSYIDRTFQYTIQPKGTNNSGEIGAVALGVSCAISLHNYMKEEFTPRFNLFSDSLISIRGVREWMEGWIARSDKDGNLRNSSGSIVANQEFFKFIFNAITANPDIDINFLHQDGHVLARFDSIRTNFQKFNGIQPEDVGKSPESLCMANDFVDRETRKIINQYLSCSPEYLPDDWQDSDLDLIMSFYKNDKINDCSPANIAQYRKIVSYVHVQ